MNRSLQSRLARMLSLAVVAVGLLAASLSFYLVYEEAKEFQDNTLREIAAVTPVGQLAHYAQGDHLEVNPGTDPEDQVWIFELTPGSASPHRLPNDLTPGYHTIQGEKNDWRVFVRAVGEHQRLAVAQDTAVRDELALSSALHTLVPLLALIPLLVWLIVRITRSEFESLRHLSQTIDRHSPEQPIVLADHAVPEEVVPFVLAINRLLERVASLVSGQRRFIADAAHELRTPLAALSLQAQNLERAESMEVMRARVVPLKGGIERARKLTEQLLSLARNQTLQAQPSEINVAQLLRELIVEYFPIADARKIDLGLDLCAEQVKMTADPQLLRLLLKNGLDNALRYTNNMGEVTLRLNQATSSVTIEIIDSGSGIPGSDYEKVFEPFVRLGNSDVEGSGLGLAIARDAASRLAGTLTLHNRKGRQGLVFRYQQTTST